MHTRKVSIITIIGLVLTLLLQIGGLLYAYRSNMEAMKVAVNKNFAIAFYETNDNLVNRLPYPDGTSIAYMPLQQTPELLTRDEQNLKMNEQLAKLLKDEYHITFPINELETVLIKKLRQDNIDSKVIIHKIDISTGKILDSTRPEFNGKLGVLTSNPVFIDKEKGEAVQAIIISPYVPILRKISIFYILTFGLMLVVVYSIASQIRRIVRQQQAMKLQEASFYALAEKMKAPISDISGKMQDEHWQEIEAIGSTLLGMTEETLTTAKEAARQNQGRKQNTYKILSIISLASTLLLLTGWFGFLYYTGYEDLDHKVNTHFEEAFFDEIGYKQLPYYLTDESKTEQLNYPETSLTPVAQKQKDEAIRSKIPATRIYVLHIYNSIDVNYTLRSALKMLEAVNSCASPAPFSLQFMDSAFTVRLKKAGIDNQTVINISDFPERNIKESTSPSYPTKALDLTTGILPLNNDSTRIIQGIIVSPQLLILKPLWPLLISLGLMLILIVWCVFYQIKIILLQRRLVQFQKDFTYAMIHDMKSPLNSILMGAHILAAGKINSNPVKKDKYLCAIDEECEHLLTLSNRVILLTQIEKDELQLHKNQIALKPLLEDLTGKFQLKARKQVEFSITFHRCDSVYADSFCLREILSNLIDNAIKYSREVVRIDIICEEENGFTKIKVCDNGLGIPLKEQNKIFDKFERAAVNKRSNASGFGLGLNYVQQVMIAHNGKIGLESIENKFSEFTLYFPVAAQ